MKTHKAMATVLHAALLCGASAALKLQLRASESSISRRTVLFAPIVPLALPHAAIASGGATAGKTTSIPRAKIRYYPRMSQVIFAYKGLGSAISSGDAAAIKKAKTFFWAESDDAPGTELKSVGYLLAVAFKIDSKIPPDKIPAVKEYKKMMADVEALKKAMGGSKPSEASKAYAASTASLNVYLDAVDLPTLGDARYSDPSTACFFKCD